MLGLLKRRRSIRKYKDEQLTHEEIAQLVTAALLSPSSRNRQPWEFVVVTDREMLRKLSVSKPSSAIFLKDSALGMVILADPGISDVWIEDTSIASLIVHLTAASLNLGSCWIQIRGRQYSPTQMSEDYIKELLGIPDNFAVEAIIAVGCPDEQKSPHSEKELDYSKVHVEKFGIPWR